MVNIVVSTVLSGVIADAIPRNNLIVVVIRIAICTTKIIIVIHSRLLLRMD